MRVHGGTPALRGCLFDLQERIIALRLQNEITLIRRVQTDDKIGLVIVHLAVMEIWDGEAETGILHKRTHGSMRVDVICRGLFPLPCVRNYVITPVES